LDRLRGQYPWEKVLTDYKIDEATEATRGSIDLIWLARIILLRKIVIAAFVLSFAILAGILAFLIKPVYTARATFLPPNSLSAGTSLQSAQLSALGGAGGLLGGIKDPSMIYVGILESRSVADELIQEFNLQSVYKTKKLSATEKSLAGHTKFIPGKDSLIGISVDDTDPRRAADIANAYLKALSKQNDRLVLTEAGQRRAFFEQELEKEKNQLADAEVELARTQLQTGLISPNGQAQVQINTIAQTRAAISSREIELTAMNQGATEQNPEVIRLRSEIAELKEQLARLENSSAKGSPGDVMVPTSKVPELSLEYVRRDRDVKYHEALYELLLRQYESAKLDESHSAPLVQIVDAAVVPDSKSWPPHTLLVLLGAFIGGVFGIALVTFPYIWEKKMQSPLTAANWRLIQESARFRTPQI
jgi:tyrosine-protein kinase Etk/Wzc